MIENVIEYCIRNRFLVLILAAGLAAWGAYAVVDGHHRVSVARARGAGTIDAWVHGPLAV